MAQSIDILGLIKESLDQGKYRDEHWEGSFDDYLGLVTDNPLIVRTAHQRVYDMVLSHGVEEVEQDKIQVTHYKFFEDLEDNGVDGLFGLDNSLAALMSTFKAAAHGYGPDRRVLLLHGPVGSSKSTIVRLLKKGLEHYSRKAEGALYTFSWKVDDEIIPSPMNEEPLLLIPQGARRKILSTFNKQLRNSYQLQLDLNLSPVSRYYLDHFLNRQTGGPLKIAPLTRRQAPVGWSYRQTAPLPARATIASAIPSIHWPLVASSE